MLPYCWKDETPLSNHELRMDDDVYKNRQDQTVTVTFPITAGESELSRQLAGVQALAWTTTPGRCPPTRRSPSGLPSATWSRPPGPNGIKAAAAEAPVTGSFLLAADLLAPTPRTWLRRRRRGRCRGRGRGHLHPHRCRARRA